LPLLPLPTSEEDVLSQIFASINMAPFQATLCLDLTADVEECATCGTALGQGSGNASHIFVLKHCRRVSKLPALSVKVLSIIGGLRCLHKTSDIQDSFALSKCRSYRFRPAEVSPAVQPRLCHLPRNCNDRTRLFILRQVYSVPRCSS
jgi:hypothetical protein